MVRPKSVHIHLASSAFQADEIDEDIASFWIHRIWNMAKWEGGGVGLNSRHWPTQGLWSINLKKSELGSQEEQLSDSVTFIPIISFGFGRTRIG